MLTSVFCLCYAMSVDESSAGTSSFGMIHNPTVVQVTKSKTSQLRIKSAKGDRYAALQLSFVIC